MQRLFVVRFLAENHTLITATMKATSLAIGKQGRTPAPVEFQ